MLSIKSLSDPAIPAPGIRPRAMKTYVHTETGTFMTTAAFFVTAGRKDNPSVRQLTKRYSGDYLCNTRDPEPKG